MSACMRLNLLLSFALNDSNLFRITVVNLYRMLLEKYFLIQIDKSSI